MRVLIFWMVLGFSVLSSAIPETTVSHRPGDFIQAIQNDPEAGREIYQEFCASCHAAEPRIKLGAPRYQNQDDWKPYSQLDLNSLLKMADAGMGQMPPRGGCFECTDENLKAAIVYMLPVGK